MTTGELSYREEKQVERILFYLTEYDGPQDDPVTGTEHGPLYREIQRMARLNQPYVASGHLTRDHMVSLVLGRIVPKVITAFNKAFPGEMGNVTPAAKKAAAERIYDEIVTMEMEILAESGRRSRRWAPAFRRTAGPGLDRLVEERIGAALARR